MSAYFDNGDLDLYCMLSAADKIIMDSLGTLSFTGYTWGRFFAKESLDKLGVGFRELRYLDYKSANESFSRTSLSPVDREQYGAYLDEIFDLAKTTIIRNRSLEASVFDSLLAEGISLSPAEAKKRGLVDVLGRRDAVREITGSMEFGDPENGTVDFISAGNLLFSFFNQEQKVPHYYPVQYRRPGTAEIAVIHARGNTDLERGMGARNIARLIRGLAEKTRIKAMVIRIDSPGGSAVAADFIAEAVKDAKKKIPVVVSMGQTAASGGYWAAMYGSRVIAAPCTLTGSIGVIGAWFFDKGLIAKLGLGFEALTRGEHANLGTGIILPGRDLHASEEEQFRRCILDLYDEFVKKAAEGRSMKYEDLEKLARGRVYSGLAAKQLGLADSIGGYLEALEIARNLAKIPGEKKVNVREYPRPKFFENITARLFSSALAAGPGPEQYIPFKDFSGFMGELWEELRCRISYNGKAMPILPLVLESKTP